MSEEPQSPEALLARLADRDRELRSQRAIATCASTLLAPESAQRIEDAMQAILEAADVTTVFVERNVEHPELGLCTDLLVEVSIPGVEIDRSRWSMVPWSRLPDSYAKLSRGLPYLGNIGDLGTVEAATYAGIDTIAEANYPVILDGVWRGIVGFSDRRHERTWTTEDERLLAAAADLFARLWEREDHERQLEAAVTKAETLYEYERALASCSQVLLSGTDDAALELAVDALLEVTSADFGSIERNVDHPDLGLCSQVVCRAEVPADGGPPIHEFDDYWFLVPWSQMPDSEARLSKGAPFAFRVADLGPVERRLYEAAPITTTAEVDIPILADGAWRGLIALGWAQAGAQWEPGDIALLQTAADMVGAFWVRQDAQARLEELIRSKDEFLAAVSHELRTPLTLVVGLAEELRDRADDFTPAQKYEFNALIAEEGMEMAHLVEDLLVAARSGSGGIDVEAVAVDVSKEIARVVSAQRSPRAITMVPSTGCIARADAMRVRQVLRNLLSNAVRYGGPSVSIRCGTEGETVVVAVVDDGPPIDARSRERIFEAYQRAHEEPSQPSSVGLGLTVSRNLARLMGGDLVYRRRDDRNVFELRLPAAEPHARDG